MIQGTTGGTATRVLSSDGLTLYLVWSSSAADKDIWFAQRTSTSAQFANAKALGKVNGPADEFRPWLARDELTVLFASTRATGSTGGKDIWIATRTSKRSGAMQAIWRSIRDCQASTP